MAPRKRPAASIPAPAPVVTLADPRALRAYAHPIRMRLVGLLREHQSLTATQAARLLGESSGTCSFHLRQLAKYGVVESLPAVGVERPWRATAHGTGWPKIATDPETAAATRLLYEVLVDRYAEQAHEWLERREHESPEWRAAAWTGDALIRVTPEELASLDKKLDKVFAPYARRVTDPDVASPSAARPVSIISIAFPRPATVPPPA
jgi:predicted ArsR family transcriptional regulator